MCIYTSMKQPLDMTSVQNCTCFNVRRVSRVITQFFDAEVRRHGIRPTQTPILRALQARNEWGMAELSEWLGMERTTLLRNLRPLQRDGLVRAKGGGRGGHVELEITARDARPWPKPFRPGARRRTKSSRPWERNGGQRLSVIWKMWQRS
jgi:hypothetical protein